MLHANNGDPQITYPSSNPYVKAKYTRYKEASNTYHNLLFESGGSYSSTTPFTFTEGGNADPTENDMLGLDGAITEVDEENERLRLKLKRKESILTSSESGDSTNDSRIQALQSQVNYYEGQISSLQNQVDAIDAEIARRTQATTIDSQVISKGAQINSNNFEIATIQNQINAGQIDSGSGQSQIAQLEAENQKLQEEINRLTQQRENLKVSDTNIDELTKQKEALIQKIVVYQRKVSDIKRELNPLTKSEHSFNTAKEDYTTFETYTTEQINYNNKLKSSLKVEKDDLTSNFFSSYNSGSHSYSSNDLNNGDTGVFKTAIDEDNKRKEKLRKAKEEFEASEEDLPC